MERRNPRPTHPGGGDRTFCMVQTPHHHVRPVDTGRGDTEVAWEQMGAIAVQTRTKYPNIRYTLGEGGGDETELPISL